jgi:hypothetical protein
MAVKESYVKVQEIIMKAPNFSNAAQTSNIGGYIVAPTGPRLAYIQSPAQFLATYTKNGKIPRKADITFINAYYLSYASGLVLARATNTTAVSGLLFVKNETTEPKPVPIRVIFKDGSLMTKRVNLKIQFNKNKVDIGASWALAVGNTVYYFDPSGNITENDAFASYQNFVEVTSPKDLATCFENMDNIHVESWTYAQGDDKDTDKYNLNLVLNFTENEGYADEGDELYIPKIYTDAIESTAYTEDEANKNIISKPSSDWIIAIKMGQTNTQGDYNFSLRNYNETTKTFDLVFKNNLTIDETTGRANPTTELYTIYVS